MKYGFLILILLFVGSILCAQEQVVQSADPEAKFVMVRNLAESDQLKAAEKLALEILQEEPEYLDVKTYLALILGRQKEFDRGLTLLDEVLQSDPSSTDALTARCSLLYWSENWSALVSATTEAMGVVGEDADLLFLQALAYKETGDEDAALAALDRLLEIEPEHPRGTPLKLEIQTKRIAPEICGRYMYDHFKEPYLRRWHMLTVGGNYPITRGTISPYLNAGHFISEGEDFLSTTAFQLNTDAYLNITQKNYILLGYGIGTGTYLPRHRAILHAWQTLPAGWAVSAGARYFYFDQHYMFYAVGVEKYLGNYWFDLKNYIFSKSYGFSMSSYLTVRRYLENEFNHVSLTVGYGTSPDEPITAVVDLQRLNAFSVRANLMKQLSGRIRIGAGIGYSYEEYNEQMLRHRWNVMMGIYYKL